MFNGLKNFLMINDFYKCIAILTRNFSYEKNVSITHDMQPSDLQTTPLGINNRQNIALSLQRWPHDSVGRGRFSPPFTPNVLE